MHDRLRRLFEIVGNAPDRPPASNGEAASTPKAVSDEQLSLTARVTAFLADRAKETGKVPTLKDVRRAFPGEIDPDATFYRNNPWSTQVRAGLMRSHKAESPLKGHRNITDKGKPGVIDASIDPPDYFADED
jgi:hypothetical protein